MSKETPNYEDFTLDPAKNVLVPMATYLAITNIMQEVEKQHSKRIRTDKYALFNNKTHARLSDKSRAKMKPEKLQKEYYENIDFDATSKNIRVDRDELGSAAVQLMGEFRGVFKMNVDLDNCIPITKPDTVAGPSPLQVVDDAMAEEDIDKVAKVSEE